MFEIIQVFGQIWWSIWSKIEAILFATVKMFTLPVVIDIIITYL